MMVSHGDDHSLGVVFFFLISLNQFSHPPLLLFILVQSTFIDNSKPFVCYFSLPLRRFSG